MTTLQAVALVLALSVASTTATCETHGDGVGFQDCNDPQEKSSESVNLLQTKMTVNRASASSESEMDDGKPRRKPPSEPKPVKGPMFVMGINNNDTCIDAKPGPKGAAYTPDMCCPEGYEDVKVSVSCAAAVASLGVNTGTWEPWEPTEEAKRITFGGIVVKDPKVHPFGCILFKFKPSPKKPLYKFKVMFNPGAGDIFGNDIREVTPGKLTGKDKVICQKSGAKIGQSTGGGAGFGLSVPKIKEEAYDEGYDDGHDDGWDEALEDEEDDDDDDDDEPKKGRR